jgi:hypothetical protein
MKFEKELEKLINRYSLENGSDTPDFILASYLKGCLDLWNSAVTTREQWYGRRKKRAEQRNVETGTSE